jgi:uncharacterized protein (DUF302 family)
VFRWAPRRHGREAGQGLVKEKRRWIGKGKGGDKDLETNPRSVEKRLKASAGEEGLMLFNVQEHGKLLNIIGSPRKAKQYVLGNPLIAVTMTRHDIRAGLYAPLTVFVYEADDRSTRIEFDQPSSLFGQFNNPEVTTVARSLDAKLATWLKRLNG